jgi:signal peptidase II
LKILKDYLSWLVISGLLVILDQWSKNWVRAHLTPGEIFRPDLWITQYVRIMNWKNTGTLGGFFPTMGNLFIVLSFVVGVTILIAFPTVSPQQWPVRLGMCLMLSGIVGNLIDRLSQGYVTDFISIGNLPVCNLADLSLGFGIGIILLSTLKR